MKKIRRKILIVEDDKILRLTVMSQLDRLECNGQAIINGLNAVAELESGNYDLVLMDVQMPVVSGLEATKAIRKWESKKRRKRIPIVAMSANPNRSQCYEAGMDDYLFKPYTLSELESILQKWAPDSLSA